MTNFLIGKDDEYLISEVIFRRMEDGVSAANIKKCYECLSKTGWRKQTHLYIMPQMAQERFKNLMPSFFNKEAV